MPMTMAGMIQCADAHARAIPTRNQHQAAHAYQFEQDRGGERSMSNTVATASTNAKPTAKMSVGLVEPASDRSLARYASQQHASRRTPRQRPAETANRMPVEAAQRAIHSATRMRRGDRGQQAARLRLSVALPGATRCQHRRPATNRADPRELRRVRTAPAPR